jgi:transposase
MEQFIGCDAHKKFSVFVAVDEKGKVGEAVRVAHDRQLYREFLARLPPHSAIAVEASGHYSQYSVLLARLRALKKQP